MTAKDFFRRLTGRDDALRRMETTKSSADESRVELDRKIDQIHDISSKVIATAHREVNHSERIIAVAEQAVRSLRKVEHQR